MAKHTIIADTIYRENKDGLLEPTSIKKRKIVKDGENQGNLMDGRLVVADYSGGNEKWYFPYKYQRGIRV